ncbi:hypothetical protein [Sphingopyxis sp. L1A2A]|uniref:hypothetical protein n=1 Tax=Sphingopyxis sp. L1A2A TaxID=2502247 RepID=UPI001484C922|nr:hypothetical protein [Sphingopyxis sp. L1A2A]
MTTAYINPPSPNSTIPPNNATSPVVTISSVMRAAGSRRVAAKAAARPSPNAISGA